MKIKLSFIVPILVLVFSSTFFSCGGDDNSGSGNGSNETSITLTASSTSIPSGNTVNFVVTNNLTQIVTSSSTIYVNNVAITGNSYTFPTVGTYQVFAKKGDLTSSTVTITVTDAATVNYVKKVLVEDFTGTWCQFCPRVSWAIKLLKDQTTNMVDVAVHQGSDPYTNADGNSLATALSIAGYPTAKLNRNTDWTYPEPNNVSQATGMITNNAGVGVAINFTSSAAVVKVGFRNTSDATSHKVVVYLVEDGLLYNQTNSTSYYNGANPIVNFLHNGVLRDIITPNFGDAITASGLSGNIYTKNVSVSFPSGVTQANTRLVAVVLNSNNEVMNVQEADYGQDKGFDLVP